MRPHWQGEMLRAIGPRYRSESRAHKTRILDEFCALTGYHRKYAIQLLNARTWSRPLERLGRPVLYGSEENRVLIQIWKAARFPSSRRLKTELPRWLPWARMRLRLKPEIERRLRRMSPRTMDRRLKRYRRAMRGVGISNPRPGDRRQAGKRSNGAARRAATSATVREGSLLPESASSAKIGRSLEAGKRKRRDRRSERVPFEKGGQMALEMKTRKRGDVMIISLSGNMVISDEHFEMMKLVIHEMKQTKKFVVDLGKVEKIDSAGVGELVALNVAVRQHDAQLRLANLDERVGKVLQMALVHKMIQTFDTQKEALASFD